MGKGSKGKKSKAQNKNKKSKSKNDNNGNNSGNNSNGISNSIDVSNNDVIGSVDVTDNTMVGLDGNSELAPAEESVSQSISEAPLEDSHGQVVAITEHEQQIDMPLPEVKELSATVENTEDDHTEDVGSVSLATEEHTPEVNPVLESTEESVNVHGTTGFEPLPKEAAAEDERLDKTLEDDDAERAEEDANPFSDSNAIAPWDHTAEQDVLPEANPIGHIVNEDVVATEPIQAPELVALDQNAGVQVNNIEAPVPENNNQDDVFPWDNTAEQDLMPWDEGKAEAQQNGITQSASHLPGALPENEQNKADLEEKEFTDDIVVDSILADNTAESTIAPPPETDTAIDASKPAVDDKLPWDDEDKAEDSELPWNTANGSSDDKQDTLIIGESSDNVAKEDEAFLNSFSKEHNETESANDDKFAFLEEEEEHGLPAVEVGDHKNEATSEKSNTEDKFDFLEEDDNILLDDVMDDDLLEDNKDSNAWNNTENVTANNTTETVVTSSERKQSKYQPQLQTTQIPENSFLYQPKSNVYAPAQTPLVKQNFSPNVLRTPPPNFAEPNQKLVSSLQKEKKKSDAYDFPQDLYLKKKPKPVKEVKQNIYTQIENSVQHPTPNSVPGYQQEHGGVNLGYQPPPPLGGFGNKYSRSNSISSNKSSSFFAELPIPKINEKKDNLHLKNPYGVIESQSSFTQMDMARKASTTSNNSVASALMPPKKMNSYIPGVAQSPQLENSMLNQRHPPIPSNPNNKFASSKSPPSVKKPSNPYAPAAVGGHVRQISTTVTNPVDSKPNIVPVPMKSPISISSPLSPSMPIFPANSKNGVIQSNASNAYSQKSYSGSKYAPSSIPQPPYQSQPSISQQTQYQQFHQPPQGLQQQSSFNTSVQYPPSAPMYNPPMQGSYMPKMPGQAHTVSPQMQQQQSLVKEAQYSNGLGLDSHSRINSFGKNKVSAKGHKHSGSSINEVYGSTIELSNATSTATRKPTTLPPSLSKGKHSVPPVSTLTPAPVVINPENLVRRQWPLFSFSAEDKVASMIPTFDGYSHNICNIKVTDIATILKEDNLISAFPGPLIKGKTKKKDVSKWLEDKLDSFQKIDIAPSLPEELIWKCLKLMLEKIEKPGDFLDRAYIKDVAALLNPSLNVSDAMNNTFDIIELARLSKNFDSSKPFNSFSLDYNGLAAVHKMLEVGDKKSALELAVAEGDWAVALLISHLMGPIAFDQTIKLYAATHFQNDAMGQDLSFFVQSKSQGGFSVDQLKGKETWLVENFKIVVPFVMMDNPDYGKVLLGIGEALMKAGYVVYGKLSFILSGLPLIPKALGQITSSIYGMIIEEVYAFILLTSGNVPPNFSNGFPHMIPLKIRHGGYLADTGYSVEAKKYCDSTQALIASKQFFCEPVTLIAQNNLCDRLSQVGSGWLSSKLSRPQLDRVWTTLDKSFNKFVSGEDVPQSETKTEGVFAKFTSPASISRTSSTLDLVEIQNQINRKPIGGNPYVNSPSHISQPIGPGGSYGGPGIIPGARSYFPPSSIQDNAMARNASFDSISSYTNSSAPHPPASSRYTPGTNLANISSESVVTTASQPASNSTLSAAPYDENRKPNIFNPAPVSKVQYSPKAPPPRTLSSASVYTPAVKSLSSSPVATKTYAPTSLPNENLHTNTSPLSLPPKSQVLSSTVQQYTQSVPPSYQRSKKTYAKLEIGSPAQDVNERVSFINEGEDRSSQSENSKTALLAQKEQLPYAHPILEHEKVDLVDEKAELPASNGKPGELTENSDPEEPEKTEASVESHATESGEGIGDSYTEDRSFAQPANDAVDKPKEKLHEELKPDSDDVNSNVECTTGHEAIAESHVISQDLPSVVQENLEDTSNGHHSTDLKKDTQISGESEAVDVQEVTEVTEVTESDENKESKNVKANTTVIKPPSATSFRPNASRAASRTVNRYGPSTASSKKRAVNPYASMYAPKQASPKSPYGPPDDSDNAAADTGIPADVSPVDMFSFGGYTPAPPVSPSVKETVDDAIKSDVKDKVNEEEAHDNEVQETDYKSEFSESKSEENNFVPTYKPPTQVGVKGRKSPVQSEIKLADMFTPPTGFPSASNRPAVSSPIHQFTEEKRYYAQDTGEYYDDVIDEDSDDDSAEAARKANEEKKKLEEEKKRKEEEEKKKKEEAKKKDSNRGSEGGRWFGWLGKSKNDDKPKPIKAKLGEENSFYYDEKLKRWINKKAPLEEQLAASKPPPPPAMKKANTVSAIPNTGEHHTGTPVGPPTPSSISKPPTPGTGPPISKAAKKDGIDDLLTMSTAVSARKNGRRGPRRGYVDVMAQK